MKEYKFNKATVFMESALLEMSEEEADKWVTEELAKGNPILKEIERVVNECYRERMERERAHENSNN
jgi:hypothetical protein